MKAIEFDGTVTQNGQIVVPAGIAQQLPLGESLHIVLQWHAEADESGVWRTEGRKCFEAAYAPEDTVYDDLTR